MIYNASCVFCWIAMVEFIHHQFTIPLRSVGPTTICRGRMSLWMLHGTPPVNWWHLFWGKIEAMNLQIPDSKKFEKMLSHIQGWLTVLFIHPASTSMWTPPIYGCFLARGHLSWFTAYLQSGGSLSSSGLWLTGPWEHLKSDNFVQKQLATKN